MPVRVVNPRGGGGLTLGVLSVKVTLVEDKGPQPPHWLKRSTQRHT